MLTAKPNPNAAEHKTRDLWRRWIFLLPAVFVTYSLSYLDRANFGFGAAAGLAATLKITGEQTSLLSGLFFLGYFVFQLPGAAFARRRSASWLIFAALLAWGTFAALTGVIRVFWLLALDRFMVGVAESVIFPAMLLLLTRWFTRAERSRANAFLILGNPLTVLWMSVVTGYLIESFGWQRTFVLEGLPSIVWAFVWIVFVKDRPAAAKWLSRDSAETLERELAGEQARFGIVIPAVRQAFVRADVLLLSVLYFFWSLGVYGFVLWLPTMVRRGTTLSMGRTGLLSAMPYAAGVFLMMLVSFVSDKLGSRERLVWPFLLLGGAALLGSFLLSERSFVAAFTCLVVGGGCMYAPYGPFFAIFPERLPATVTAEVLALVNSAGALGGFVGSYLVGWLGTVTGNSRAGYLLMSVALGMAGVVMLLLPPSKTVRSELS
ncbi:MFS transporter [Granulicella sp. S190]|uniref:MFS transporter n=1 Tax=Granulicella sp. S190 TaxID=1747226 RepID=UPI00131E8DF3|nr:MFS transporter [Granulicella sp. S190]